MTTDPTCSTAGSPAHAGIDPQQRPRRHARPRLPRTRGDRPSDKTTGFPDRQAPPHTRGSTPESDPRAIASRGSPAHAGIDPLGGLADNLDTRLPRTRGDRPMIFSPLNSTEKAPPHTRGSTPRPGWRTRPAPGSPAHAGIDLSDAGRRQSRTGLPRTRGDRPLDTIAGIGGDAAPPHTRGSTSGERETPVDLVGSPAHAGIDPLLTMARSPLPRLPRTRGDRPTQPEVKTAWHEAPPHTRGSTFQ